ncbi:hypothetical protein N7513_004957 [Penicillium frequentans]|nr:hypothetical protein N7513_004957 [Penicillium glabrum]
MKSSGGLYLLLLSSLLIFAYLNVYNNIPIIIVPKQQKVLSEQMDQNKLGILADTFRPRLELHAENHIFREPVAHHYTWHVTKAYRRPDGVRKEVYLINGILPGPTIEARAGDTLVISVQNHLEDEVLSIHWHGLHIKNSMDGVPGVTQCAIEPEASFTYNFTIPNDQNGTFWYHAHTDLQRTDGLYGGLIVHAPYQTLADQKVSKIENATDNDRFGYEKELLLLIGDWYHQPAQEAESHYMSAASFGSEPVPDSLLINGIGQFDCDMAVPAHPLDCIQQYANTSFLNIDRRFSYRIRVVNTGSLAGFTLQFSQEILEVIHLDSSEVRRQKTENIQSAGILYPGQRVDFVLRSDRRVAQDSPSSMTVILDKSGFRRSNLALTAIQSFGINQNHSSTNLSIRNDEITHLQHVDLENVSSSPSVLSALPANSQQTHVVYTKIQMLAINANMPWGYFNHSSWRPQKEPPYPLINLPRNQWDENQFSFSTNTDPVWVDLIVNNLDDSGHPFHLHGHHFFVLYVYKAPLGWGSYNPFKDAVPPGISVPPMVTHDTENSNPDLQNVGYYDLDHAILRDTVQIPSRGYAVLRFRADNPGVWLFHCHISWHLSGGMAMIADIMGDMAGEEPHNNLGSNESCQYSM